MRTRQEICDDTPGEASRDLDFAILRVYLERHLEVLLDIRDLLERSNDEERNPPTPAGGTKKAAGGD